MTHDGFPDWCEEEREAERLQRRRYARELADHPMCSDPDHPGCAACVDELEEQQSWT